MTRFGINTDFIPKDLEIQYFPNIYGPTAPAGRLNNLSASTAGKSFLAI
jgi:hypothetical protein